MNRAAYALHLSGDCWPPTCPVCAQEPEQDEPEQPILCAHHQQLLGAMDANSTGVDLDSLAATFARGCDHCQEA